MKTWKDADRVLRKLGEIEAKIADREATLTRLVNEVREKGEGRIKPLKDEYSTLVTDLEAFAREHVADFGEKKSRQLTYGQVGFRESTRIVIPDQKATIAALRRRRALAHCIRTKTVHEVDVTALRALDDKKLAAVGAERKTDDKFFAKPQRETVKAA